MLDFIPCANSWEPPELTDRDMLDCLAEANEYDEDHLVIFQVKPYIDALFIPKNSAKSVNLSNIKRFTFHEGYHWSLELEICFVDSCLNNPHLTYTYTAINSIYNYYNEKKPDWHLKRYWTKNIRLLDHIYHCMRKGTVKEILYKAGLDELAANLAAIDEINLLASNPSDIYDGMPIRVLRSLNSHAGSMLLGTQANRSILSELQLKYPNTFDTLLNDAQCKYIGHLMEMNLTAGEIGRLFRSRRKDLSFIWINSQFELFMHKERTREQLVIDIGQLGRIDPIYKKRLLPSDDDRSTIMNVRNYLLLQREEYDRKIRRSNRKRNSDWQERKYGYVVRYPQTINDFCREAVYMSNCLLGYVEAYVHNDTTILFMRNTEDVNKPLITIEIYKGELLQAFHKFNEDCTEEEAEWIRAYCKRHDIECGRYQLE